MAFEHKIKKISKRDWSQIKSAWIAELATLQINPPGKAPEYEISELYDLEQAFKSVKPEGEHREQVKGIRPALMHESIFMLHKSANVLTAAHQQATGGLSTWSIATAYQAAFFGKAALLGLLGLSIVEINNKTAVVDVWPGINESASKRQKSNYKIGSECQIVQHGRLEHFHRWAILKRALRTVAQSPIDGSWINAIDEIEDKDFAKPRNRLHYNNTWNFPDLHSFLTPLDYLNFSSPVDHIKELNPGNPRFSIYLATSLLSVACSLLKDIGLTATTIKSEFDLVSSACDYSRLTARSKYEFSTGQAFI